MIEGLGTNKMVNVENCTVAASEPEMVVEKYI
jgi:hypothetical protein